ncbi:hypothetical protein E1B28_013428 [Marasmius oreades]|uniref:Amidohydrolase 3 domain-containing protein n=1 Tax=Marasmius oreades TaxID=181124 RepID=A0A9P7RPU4_9AGAR|nr:uncharacterized protein E1B28_013428 [Marasmius oreades]KAG7087462.1 hypothetical protein E1B28_013428 [Marasmius oreades]
MAEKVSMLKNNPKSSRSQSRSSLTQALAVALTTLVAFSAFRFLQREHSVVCSKTESIYTVDSSKPRVECIAIDGSQILDTGSLDDVLGRLKNMAWTSSLTLFPSTLTGMLYRPPKVIFIDPSSIIVPGLADAHAHIIENGFKMQLQLDGADSVAEVIERIKDHINKRPDMPEDHWIEGMGWDQNRWPDSRFPTAADLDSDPLLKGRPIALRRVDGHATWVSSRVLELMGELPSEVDGGTIVRDNNGNPTGIFVDNAIALIPAPEWTESQLSEYFDATMKAALSFGLTSIHDADTLPQMRKFFIKQAKAGKIPMRLYVMLNGHLEVPEKGQLIKYGKQGRLTIRSIKLYTDGALGSWGAALLEPYADKPDTMGIMRSTAKEMDQLVRNYWKDGWQVNIHCIGDRANHVILNVFEGILQGTQVGPNVTEWRPRIEHAQIMTQADLKRAGTLGVTTSVQPTHATSDMWYAETRLGPDRIKGAYAYQTQLKNSRNGILPLGSDFPVEGVNPLLGFYAAVSRLAPDGTSPHGTGGWYPSERLTRTQALKGMTLDAAYASFMENEIGSLEPGKKADFVVLDKDIMTVPVDEILSIRVVATVIDGEVVHGNL